MKASHHSELINHIKKKLPVACGVYLFFNAEGRVIYVGKSVRIRNRVLDHFRQTNDSNFSWKGILSDNACYVRYIITNDELLALLIEDKLIKTYKPTFNVRQKQFQNYKYLGITNGLFPGIKIYGHSLQTKHRLIFGPFKNRLHIELLITLIQKYFRLRICSDASPLLKCVYYDIELCKGPCTGKILPFAYTATVNDVICFLNGNMNRILPELKRDLKSNISSLEFENAEKIRKMIDFCTEYSRKQFHYNLFKNKILEIFNKVNGEVRYRFDQGRIHCFAHDADTDIVETEVVKAEYQPFNDLRILLDRGDIIYNWLKGHTDEFDYHYS